MVKGHLPHPSPKTSGLFPVICSIYASHDMLPAPGSFANLAPQSFGPRTAAPVTRLAAPRRVLGFTCPEPQSPRDLNRDRDVSGAARALRPSLEKPRICKSRGRKDGSGADASGIDAAKVFPSDIM